MPNAKAFPDHHMDVEEVEELLKKEYPALKLAVSAEEEERMKKLSFEDLVHEVLDKTYKHNTLYAKDFETFKAGETQCKPGKNRSAGDLYHIISYYYKGTFNIVYLVQFLQKIIADKKYTSLLCPDIRRRVYLRPYPGWVGGSVANLHMKDEYGWQYKLTEDVEKKSNHSAERAKTG